MPRLNRAATLQAVVFCFAGLAQGQATTHSALSDFSLAGNPIGAWSCLYNNALMMTPVSNGAIAGLIDWQGAVVIGYGEGVGKVVQSTPVTAIFDNGQDSFIFPTDHLFLSTALGNITVRFTAPSSGLYTVTGDFLGIETAQVAHSVVILLNGAQIVSGTIATYNQSFPFTLTQTLHVGDTVDFVDIGPSTFLLGYMTGLAATIAPAVPPSINPGGIVSASAFGAFPSAAPGTWIEIYGSNLAADTRGWTAADFSGINAPTSLDGTSVTIAGIPAFVDFISPGQVNALIPSNVPTGAQQLTVTTPAGTTAPYSLTINTVEPGLLAPANFKIGGTQYSVALFADGTYVLPTGAVSGLNSRPAKSGDIIVIYGVGFGPVTPNIPAGQLAQEASTLASDFHISIGGIPCVVQYDGLAPNYTGLYQFNIVVPSGIPSGAGPLTFAVGGTAGAQTLYIAAE